MNQNNLIQLLVYLYIQQSNEFLDQLIHLNYKQYLFFNFFSLISGSKLDNSQFILVGQSFELTEKLKCYELSLLVSLH